MQNSERHNLTLYNGRYINELCVYTRIGIEVYNVQFILFLENVIINL